MNDLPQLRASTYLALFETAPDSMIVVDTTGRIVLANPQAEKMFNYPAGTLRGQSIDILVPERIRAVHGAYRDRYAHQPRVRPMGKGQELTGRRKDGSEFPVEIGLSPIESEDGLFYAASIRDISETQRALQSLARAGYDKVVAQLGRLALESQGYEAMLETMPELVAKELQVDTIALVNQTRERTNRLWAATGLSPELEELLSLLMRQDYFSGVLRFEEAYVASVDELPDGKSALIRRMLIEAGYDNLVAVPLFDRGRPMGALVAAARAAYAFNRDKVHFLRSVANLLAAAVQRTRTEEQLAHAQRLESVGQLTGGIAHDFNNLLTVISGNLQLLEDDLAGRPQLQDVAVRALRAVSRGAELTRKLLAFARRQRLNPQSINPRLLLEEIGPMLARTLGETVKVEIQYGTGLPDVFVDPAELDAAILNLSINARDAMPRGGVLHIEARERVVDAADASSDLVAGHYVIIEVRDTGLGMTPEVLARAFEPFFTTKDTGRGSGLGLSMVYGFVKQSGGHLTAESRLGYGTCIDLYLPAVQPAPPQAVADAVVSSPLPEGKQTILVVEDEPAVRSIAVAFLQSQGYRTHEAADAERALELLRAHRDIALLFTDVILGSGMNGGELAQAAQQVHPDLRVLLTSGYEHPISQAEVSGPPASLPLLRKPYRREELLTMVRQALTTPS